MTDDAPSLKITVGKIQFDATGGPDDAVADLREEFEEVWRFIEDRNDSRDVSEEDLETFLREREENQLDSVVGGVQ